MMLHFTSTTLIEYLEQVFPQIKGEFTILELAERHLKVKLNIQDKHLRPGGTVSGPSMFSLADVSVYMAIMAMIGPEPLAVTTGCSLDFMRKPVGGRDIIASCTLLKLGRSLAVGDVLIHSEGMYEPVARATMTYSIPQKTRT
ncbi:MAG: thioesterase [Deltaproteobacteria bacterium]|nr:thioesterase [Deltaproteobacteria bacterium]MDG2294481.1 PaaI family thioesterase [Paracoccaceae bacterium]